MLIVQILFAFYFLNTQYRTVSHFVKEKGKLNLISFVQCNLFLYTIS